MSQPLSYDLCLFGVTGFTGKLALDYLVTKKWWTKLDKNGVLLKIAVCGRNEEKVKGVVDKAYSSTGLDNDSDSKSQSDVRRPDILVADLIVNEKGSESYSNLESVVKQSKVVLTTAGPFEKYSQSLVEICVNHGVHYCDITGESDFFRQMIEKFDFKARENKTAIVMHCGNDCIPYDLLVYEMNEVCKKENLKLSEVKTYTEVPPSASMSGGTLTTAAYQMTKPRNPTSSDSKDKEKFDPLLTNHQGSKSSSLTKVGNPKSKVFVKEFERSAGPWIMGPVMANCVRRSNALLSYNDNFSYSEAMLEFPSYWDNIRLKGYSGLVGLAIYVPSLFSRFLPAPGEGPELETMEKGWLVVHARGKGVDMISNNSKDIVGKIQFPMDTGYLMTAHMLIESGFMLLDKCVNRNPETECGVITPAVAFKGECLGRMEKELGVKYEISVV